MFLHQLERVEGCNKTKKRVGRGPGSGLGKTSGRGHKGDKARSGRHIKKGFEGGQMPLYKRSPKFGFANQFRREFIIINLSDLEKNLNLNDSEVITRKILEANGIIPISKHSLKLLGDGRLTKSLKIEVDHFSLSAAEKVRSAGGEILLVKR